MATIKSIEEKAKAYDELKVKAQELTEDGYIDKLALLDLFPELKESIDERIKKVIKQVLSESTTEKDECYLDNGVTQQEVFAWLEKHGEQKLVINVPPREVILSIWDLGNEWKDLTNGCISTEHGTQLDYIQKHWHESEYYLKERLGEQPKKHDVCDNCDQQGYCVSPCPMKLIEKHGEQKPAWSEEDESMLYGVIETEQYMLDVVNGIKKFDVWNGDIRKACAEELNWLKSLKGRVQPQPNPAWGEKDRRMLIGLIDELDAIMNKATSNEISVYSKYTNWLKSLKERYTWKPSDEQMSVIEAVINNRSFQRRYLDSLYADLKKLRKE